MLFRRRRQVPGILRYWGFRWDNFLHVTKTVLPFAVLALLTSSITGYVRGTLNITWHIFPILVLYPVWGCIQQFLTMALVAGNLQDLRGRSFSKIVIVFGAALLFGLMHYPYPWLMAGTFILALLYGRLYLKARNVFVMGLFHGWLGAIFFYTVVGRDPFLELFEKLAGK